MTLAREQYDPIFMEENEHAVFLNEIADIVAASKEGQTYLDLANKKKGHAGFGEKILKGYIRSIVTNYELNVSIALMNAFNQAACTPDALKQECASLRANADAHFQGQIRQGGNLSDDDYLFNAHVELYAASSRMFIDRLVARLG